MGEYYVLNPSIFSFGHVHNTKTYDFEQTVTSKNCNASKTYHDGYMRSRSDMMSKTLCFFVLVVHAIPKPNDWLLLDS